MKTTNIVATAEAAVQVTRAAPLFDRLADTMVARVEDRLPERHDESLRAQALRALRERLDAFYPEFRMLYGGLLVKHLGAEQAPRVLAALEDDSVQHYFRAVHEMQSELWGGLERLADRMALAVQMDCGVRGAPAR
ncbi:MAG TPA: hypothetical protein VFS67_35440 [Polyangiaceae bacterium]|jgi:hypothetical protein|nr:hypothetical protein [Polyangiaceae bacterium]